MRCLMISPDRRPGRGSHAEWLSKNVLVLLRGAFGLRNGYRCEHGRLGRGRGAFGDVFGSGRGRKAL